MLSVAINIKNGEKYLKRCLNALSKFEDVVILDNYSTDNTVAIAKSYPNVRLFQAEFCGMGKVRNLLAEYAKYDWVFFIDSDEIIHQKLVDCLLSSNFTDNSVYQFKRHNFYANFYVDGSSWDNDWVTRLYNRHQTKYTEIDVHESVITTGFNIKKITSGFIYHFPYDNVAQLIDKMQFYSTLYAKQNLGKKKPRLYSLPLRTLLMFFKCYVLKRGFMYGFEGLTISCYNAMGVFSKYIKLYELVNQSKIGLALSIPNDLGILNSILESINAQTLLPEQVVFLILDQAVTTVEQERLIQAIKNNLVIPGEIIASREQETTSIMQGYMATSISKYIVNVGDYRLLNNSKFFKQCKTGILHAKPVFKSKIYSK